MNINFSSKITELKKLEGISSKELAERSGLSPALISKIENGETKSLTMNTCRSLANGLSMSFRAFLEYLGYLDVDNNTSFNLISDALKSNGFSSAEVELISSYAKFIKQELRLDEAQKSK